MFTRLSMEVLMADPKYLDPETNLLRCPINGFQNCVKHRCFFWTSGKKINAMYDGVGVEVKNREVKEKEFMCALWAWAYLSPYVFRALGRLTSSLRAKDSVPDLSAHRRLERIERLLSDLLKRTEKP